MNFITYVSAIGVNICGLGAIPVVQPAGTIALLLETSVAYLAEPVEEYSACQCVARLAGEGKTVGEIHNFKETHKLEFHLRF